MDRMLYAFAEANVGAIVRSERIDRGTTAAVWRVDARAGRFALKQHRPGRTFAQECAALVAVADLDVAPRLVGSDPEQRAMITTWLDGSLGDEIADEAARNAMFRAAAEIRQALDHVPCPEEDDVPLAAALARRLQSALGRSALDVAIERRVRDAFVGEAFVGEPRRLCHRDFAPYNWIVARGARVRCLDFGHARADHRLVDVARACAPSHCTPAMRDALLAAYPLDDRDLAALHRLELFDAVATLAWARGNDEPSIAAHGRAAIDVALARITLGSRT